MKMISGKWKVVALGKAAVFNRLGDVKIISDGLGHNRCMGCDWGYFKVVVIGEDKCVLDYNDPANPALLRPIKDEISYSSVRGVWHGKMMHGAAHALDFELHPL